MTNLPDPIQRFFESSNRGDPVAVVSCFTPDAILNDWGRQFEGHAGVASWDKTDNTGVQSHLQMVSATPAAEGYAVTVQVRGNGFNGNGRMYFQLEDDKIARLDIK
ncbi:nuclear transport factor 2 family protein [Pseudochelatococcus sp. B33]